MQPLSKPLQTRVNRLAHRFAAQQESRIKSELIEQLQAARKNGATLDDLTRMLDELEGQPSHRAIPTGQKDHSLLARLYDAACSRGKTSHVKR